MVKSPTMSQSVTTPAASGSAASASGPGVASPTFSPLYQQIKSLIMQSLQSGEWKPGELIPSEVELAFRYKVSQGTVRKAIDELSAENLVVRRQGKGTLLRLAIPLFLYGVFSILMRRLSFLKKSGCRARYSKA